MRMNNGLRIRVLKKFLAVVLSVSMIVGLVGIIPPVEVQAAAEKTITGLGIGAISDPKAPESTEDSWTGSYVYFGQYAGYPVKYRVLDSDTTRFGDRTMFLDSNDVLFLSRFSQNNFAGANTWEKCDLRKHLNTDNDSFLKTSFSDTEQSAIAKSYIESYDIASTFGQYMRQEFSTYTALSGDEIFCLDYEDVLNPNYGYFNDDNPDNDVNSRKKTGRQTVPTDEWWLRSSSLISSISIGRVSLDGFIGTSSVYGEIAVSPALNVKHSSILFSSLVDGTVGQLGAEYKLTIIDSDISVELQGLSSATSYEHIITVPYYISGAHAANVTQISVLVTDKEYTDPEATVLQYGKLSVKTDTDWFGIGTFELSDAVTGTAGADYHVYIVAEDVNGEEETDYASAPFEITVPDVNKTITGLGTGTIINPAIPVNKDVEWHGNYVYFGEYKGEPVKYRVLDVNTNDYGSKTMFLDCDTCLFAAKFRNDDQADDAKVWAQSDIRKKLNEGDDSFLKTSFSLPEQTAIASSTRGEHFIDPTLCPVLTRYFPKYTALSRDKVFLLDYEDIINENYGYYPDCGVDSNFSQYDVNNHRKNNVTMRWLRSSDIDPYREVAAVTAVGGIEFTVAGCEHEVSPALNVKHSSILFSSLIEGTAGDYDAEYKLTIIDSAINLSITTGSDIAHNGNVFTVPYTLSGANVGNVTRLSVLVTDKEHTDPTAQVLQYGKLSVNGEIGTSGTADITLSNTITGTWGEDYHIYLIAEDVNGTYQTDYASAPLEVAPASNTDPSPPSPPNPPSPPDPPYIPTPTVEKYTITFDANGGTYIGGNIEAESGKGFGFTYDPSTIYRPGYFFAGWFSLPEGGDRIKSDTICDGSVITLYAHWTKVFTGKVWSFASKSYSKGRLTVTATKPVTLVSGYEFAYSVDGKTWVTKHKATKDMTDPTTTMYFLKLKSGVYKVRLRAYRLDSAGEKVYGAWSDIRSTQVK